MFPQKKITEVNPPEYSRCEEREPITEYGNSLSPVHKTDAAIKDSISLMSFKRGKLAIVRVDLPDYSPVINKQIQEIRLPADSVLVSIVRKDEVIVPKGNTVLQSGDDIIALTLVGNEPQLLAQLVGEI